MRCRLQNRDKAWRQEEVTNLSESIFKPSQIKMAREFAVQEIQNEFWNHHGEQYWWYCDEGRFAVELYWESRDPEQPLYVNIYEMVKEVDYCTAERVMVVCMAGAVQAQKNWRGETVGVSAQGNIKVPGELVSEAIQFRNEVKAAEIDDEWGQSDNYPYDFNVWTDEYGAHHVTIYPVVINAGIGSTDTSRWYTVDPGAYKD